MEKIKAILKLIGVALISAMIWGDVSAEVPSTNEQLVVSTISELSAKLIDSLVLADARIYVETQTNISGLAVDGFKSGAMTAGLTIINARDQVIESDYVAVVTLSSFNFKYAKGKSRGFMRKPSIRRVLSGQLMIKISRGDFNFLGFKEFSNSDQIEPSQMNYISSLRYNQLSPDPPGSGVLRFLEPIAVTATVGGLIYLFFINR